MEIDIPLNKLPDDITPLNLLAYLTNAFEMCSCYEADPYIAELVKLLEWCDSGLEGRELYSTLFGGNLGVFYLLAGLLDKLALTEHGTSGRFPWLTRDGKRLLAALKTTPVDAIAGAVGEAYDGCWYGEVDKAQT